MTFADAEAEARLRLAEALILLNHLRQIAPAAPAPLDDLQKAQRGLWLVALYAALERGVNAIVEATLHEVSSHQTRSVDFKPAMHSIIHFPSVQSVKDCAPKTILDKSVILFQNSFSPDPVAIANNPLANYLQNVDGGTIEWVCNLFGAAPYQIASAPRNRLSILRERRNAVAHGRETASQVGERYDLIEMARLYEAVDSELISFRLHMETYSVGKGYVRVA